MSTHPIADDGRHDAPHAPRSDCAFSCARPAPTAYDVAGAYEASASTLAAAPAFDKQSWLRFGGQASIYNAGETPAPTAYEVAGAYDATASTAPTAPSMGNGCA